MCALPRRNLARLGALPTAPDEAATAAPIALGRLGAALRAQVDAAGGAVTRARYGGCRAIGTAKAESAHAAAVVAQAPTRASHQARATLASHARVAGLA